MKDKSQRKWEEEKLLEKITKKRLLTLETDIMINSVYVNYLISSHELKKQFAIINSKNKFEKEILEVHGYRTLQTENINIPQIEFLIDYIFRH